MMTTPCPGGTGIDVDLERMFARCPVCGYTFSTVTDCPIVPPHWIEEIQLPRPRQSWDDLVRETEI